MVNVPRDDVSAVARPLFCANIASVNSKLWSGRSKKQEQRKIASALTCALEEYDAKDDATWEREMDDMRDALQSSGNRAREILDALTDASLELKLSVIDSRSYQDLCRDIDSLDRFLDCMRDFANLKRKADPCDPSEFLRIARTVVRSQDLTEILVTQAALGELRDDLKKVTKLEPKEIQEIDKLHGVQFDEVRLCRDRHDVSSSWYCY